MLKEFIQSIKENPTEFIHNLLFLMTLGMIFYVSMWIFY